jgi:hypothetical protein
MLFCPPCNRCPGFKKEYGCRDVKDCVLGTVSSALLSDELPQLNSKPCCQPGLNLESQAGNGCADDHQAEDPTEWIDSTNQLISRPHEESHIRDDTEHVFGASIWVEKSQRDGNDDEYGQGRIRPLGHGDATSQAIQEQPATRSPENTGFRIF